MQELWYYQTKIEPITNFHNVKLKTQSDHDVDQLLVDPF